MSGRSLETLCREYDELVHYGGRSDEAEAYLVKLEQEMASRLPALVAALQDYASEDNWGQSANEDWDIWLPTKHGYTRANDALEAINVSTP